MFNKLLFLQIKRRNIFALLVVKNQEKCPTRYTYQLLLTIPLLEVRLVITYKPTKYARTDFFKTFCVLYGQKSKNQKGPCA